MRSPSDHATRAEGIGFAGRDEVATAKLRKSPHEQ